MRSLSLRVTSALTVALAAWALVLLSQYVLSAGTTRRHHVESIVLILFLGWLLRLASLPAATDRVDAAPANHEWIVPAIALVASLALYWRSLTLGFLSDDFVLAEWARNGEFVSSHHVFVRPVPLLIWRVLFDVGAGPTAMHACNVLLHGANAALVFYLGRRLSLDRIVAAAAAVLFLVWPTQVEAVAWASSMSDVLMTTMVLVSTLVFARLASTRSIGLFAMLAICSAVALLTKETAIAIPGILIVVAMARWRPDGTARHEVVPLITIAAMTAVYAGWRVLVRPDVSGAIRPHVTRYVLKEQLTRTFGNLAIPLTSDATITPSWMALLFGAIVLLLIVWANLGSDRRRQSHRVMLTSSAWCLLATAPAIGYFFVGNHLEGSRYLYLAMAGWATLVAASWQTAARGAWMRVAGGVALASLTVLSTQQTLSLLTMWEAAAAQRDTLLRRADEAALRGGCESVTFTNLPVSYLGAQLFRNGFDEAFRSTRGQATGNTQCELSWDGAGFRSK